MILNNLISPTGKKIQHHHVPLHSGDTNELQQLDFDEAIIFPGLVNSHDHLDFDLFPQLGNKKYSDYIEWGHDIHRQYKPGINKVLAIPQSLRIEYGIYKNLLAGVTSVVNHGEKLSVTKPPIYVHQGRSLHSVGFEKNWQLKLNNIFKTDTCQIHVGEGITKRAEAEADRLIRHNYMHRKIIGVHGVSMNSRQARHFKALVWCPASNYFMLDTTAAVHELQHETEILFGTDSTLTASWNIWDHLRIARKTEQLSDEVLFRSITASGTTLWNLEKKPGDVVVVKNNKSLKGWDAFYATDPQDILLIISGGQVLFFDETISKNFPAECSEFSKISINECVKYVTGDLGTLVQQIRKYDSSVTFPFELL